MESILKHAQYFSIGYSNAATEDDVEMHGALPELLQLINTFIPSLEMDADVADIDMLTYLPNGRSIRFLQNGNILINREAVVIAGMFDQSEDDDMETRDICIKFSAPRKGTYVTWCDNYKHFIDSEKNAWRILGSDSSTGPYVHANKEVGLFEDHRDSIYSNSLSQIAVTRINLHPVEAIASAGDHSLFLSNGKLFASGSDRYGMRGTKYRKNKFDQYRLKQVKLECGPNCNGSACSHRVTHIATGSDFNVIIIEDAHGVSRVATCGNVKRLGRQCTKMTPQHKFCVVDGLADPIDVVVCEYWTFVLTQNGDVFIWGCDNSHNNIALPQLYTASNEKCISISFFNTICVLLVQKFVDGIISKRCYCISGTDLYKVDIGVPSTTRNVGLYYGYILALDDTENGLSFSDILHAIPFDACAARGNEFQSIASQTYGIAEDNVLIAHYTKNDDENFDVTLINR